jgi:hypothetical protein
LIVSSKIIGAKIIPEFSFVIPMLAIGFASLLIFYRIKSKF